jgi:hypothetical protein
MQRSAELRALNWALLATDRYRSNETDWGLAEYEMWLSGNVWSDGTHFRLFVVCTLVKGGACKCQHTWRRCCCTLYWSEISFVKGLKNVFITTCTVRLFKIKEILSVYDRFCWNVVKTARHTLLCGSRLLQRAVGSSRVHSGLDVCRFFVTEGKTCCCCYLSHRPVQQTAILLVGKVINTAYFEILVWKSPLCNDVCHCCVVVRQCIVTHVTVVQWHVSLLYGDKSLLCSDTCHFMWYLLL